MEAEVIRLYLNRTPLKNISRKLKMKEDDVISVIMANPTTAKILKAEAQKARAGEYTFSFYESKLGRDSLPENRKRKLRQIRISDIEMEEMGNPSTTEIRNRAMNYFKIFEIINFLEKEGKINIPDEWLGVNMSDPFWANALESQSDRLRHLLTDPWAFKRVSATMKKGESE